MQGVHSTVRGPIAATGQLRRTYSAPSMLDLPSVCDLVRDAYNKNKILRENPQRPLHRTLLQRQLWNKLQQTFRETKDTSVLAHRPALTESDLQPGLRTLAPDSTSNDATQAHPRSRSGSMSSLSSMKSDASSTSSSSSGHGPKRSAGQCTSASVAHRMKTATFPGKKSTLRDRDLHATRVAAAHAGDLATAAPREALRSARALSSPGQIRRTHTNLSDGPLPPVTVASALPAAARQAPSKSKPFSFFRRSSTTSKSSSSNNSATLKMPVASMAPSLSPSPPRASRASKAGAQGEHMHARDAATAQARIRAI